MWLGGMIWWSLSLGEVRNSLAGISLTPGPQGLQGETGQSLVGPQGVAGLTVQGPKGDKGDKGDTVVGPQGPPGADSTVAGPAGADSTVPGPPGPKGETGEQGPRGEQGAPGPTVFYRQHPLTGEEECRYAGNTDWQPIEDCE